MSIDNLRSFPYRLAFTFGRVMEILAAVRFSKNDPPLSRSMVRMIGRDFTFSDAAAQAELGYRGEISRADGMATYRAQTVEPEYEGPLRVESYLTVMREPSE